MYNAGILVSVVGLLLVLLLTQRDILSPPILHALAWTYPLVVLTVAEGFGPGSHQLNSFGLVFPVGVIVFAVGFLLAARDAIHKWEPKPIRFEQEYAYTGLLNIFILLEFVVFAIYFAEVYSYVSGNFTYNFWFTFKLGDSLGAYRTAAIAGYVRNSAQVLFLVMLTLFVESRDRGTRLLFIGQAIVTIAFSFLSSGRGAVFLLVIPTALVLLLMKRSTNRRILRSALVAVVTGLVIFGVYSVLKYPYADQTSWVFLLRQLENYSSAGLFAFCEWAASSHDYVYGANTFRFMFAVLDAFGYRVDAAPLVQPFVTSIFGSSVNVYTVYHWYAADFGIAYALVVQAILGIFHGVLYRNTFAERPRRTWLVVYAVSAFPLFMQFFMDEYVSMLSTWIQMGFWLFVFLGTGLFVRVAPLGQCEAADAS